MLGCPCHLLPGIGPIDRARTASVSCATTGLLAPKCAFEPLPPRPPCAKRTYMQDRRVRLSCPARPLFPSLSLSLFLSSGVEVP